MMRGILVVGLSVLAFDAGIVQAEARFRGRVGGHSVPLRGSLASTPGLAVIPALTLRSVDEARAARPDAGEPSAAKPVGTMTAEAMPAGEASSLKIPTFGPAAQAPVAAVKKPDEPWCRSGRVAGSGAGFCLIN